MLDKVSGFQVTASWKATARLAPYDASRSLEGNVPADHLYPVGPFTADYSELSRAELDRAEADSLALIANSKLLFASDEL